MAFSLTYFWDPEFHQFLPERCTSICWCPFCSNRLQCQPYCIDVEFVILNESPVQYAGTYAIWIPKIEFNCNHNYFYYYDQRLWDLNPFKKLQYNICWIPYSLAQKYLDTHGL